MLKTHKLTLVLSIIIIGGCSMPSSNDKGVVGVKNEVLVLGTIHSRHLTEAEYNIEVLNSLIEKINPDFILTEIPPDRYPVALKEFLDTGTIKEPRVIRFPEYIDVIFPLTKTMDFEIIPTAGWTIEMADARSKKLKEISEDSTRVDDWQQFVLAGGLSDSLIKASGRGFDPYWINSPAYDEAVEVELSVYNDLFNTELGPGGWDNINKAHYKNISDALDGIKGKGKRVLITYGAGHKGWFLRELKKRDDITLLTLEDI